MAWEIARKFTLLFGGIVFEDCVPVVILNGRPILTVKQRQPDGRFGVDLELYDIDGKHVARVSNGKIKSPLYQLEFDGRFYRIIEPATGIIAFQMERNPDGADLGIAANIYLPGTNGFALRGTPYDLLGSLGQRLSNIRMQANGYPGIVIGNGTGAIRFAIPSSTGDVPSREDREKQRIVTDKTIKQYNELRKRGKSLIFNPTASQFFLFESAAPVDGGLKFEGDTVELKAAQFPFTKSALSAHAKLSGIEGSHLFRPRMLTPLGDDVRGTQTGMTCAVDSMSPDLQYSLIWEWKEVVFDAPGDYRLQLEHIQKVIAEQTITVRQEG